MENYLGLLFESDPSLRLLISEEELFHMEEKRLSAQHHMVSIYFFLPCRAKSNECDVVTVLHQTYLNNLEIS